MDLPNLNIVDYVLLAVIVLSVVRGYSRGGIREIAGVIGWVAAFAVAFMFAPEVRPIMPEISLFGDYASSCLISAFLAFFTLFLLTLIGVSLVSPAVDRSTLGAFGAGDRVFGLLFGLIRGTVIGVGGFLLYDIFVPQQEQSEFLTSAVSHDILKSISATLGDLASGKIYGWLNSQIEALVSECGYRPVIPSVD